jgi:hypothetical protein
MSRMRHQEKLATSARRKIASQLRSAALGAFCIGVIGWNAPTAMAQDSSLFDTGMFNEAERLLDVNRVEFGIQLKKGLRVFTPEQEQFVDKVLLEVESRRLSRSMVNIIFVWAIRRNPKVPFPYFEFVMRELAKQRGVIL